MRISGDRAKTSVPATTVDLGPAFDGLGLALGLRDEVTIRAVPGDSQVRVIDSLGGSPERWLESWEVEQHLSVQALRLTLDEAGAPQVGLSVTYRQGIPPGVGLGDREARVLAGVYSAWELLGRPEGAASILDGVIAEFSVSDLRVRTAVEGGLVVRLPASLEEDASRPAADVFLSLEPSPRVNPVVLVPGFTAAEGDSADILPRAASFRRASGNAARAAALTALLTAGPHLAGADRGSDMSEQQWKALVASATADDIAQVHRRAFSPASVALVDWLRVRDQPAFLSGRGPAVVTLVQLPEEVRESAARSGWAIRAAGVARAGVRLGD